MSTTRTLEAMRAALAEFNRVEATDPNGDLTANAGIGLAMAVGDYLNALDKRPVR